jgi:hypothetical protein
MVKESFRFRKKKGIFDELGAIDCLRTLLNIAGAS